MSGHDGSRGNVSPAIGPKALPQFQPLITGISAVLRAIAPDGSLVLYSGNQYSGVLSVYTAAGGLKWTLPIAANDIAVGGNGAIIAATPTTVNALNKDTGQSVWAAPFTTGLGGNESGALAIDSAGTIYLNTGASYVGVPQRLTAIKIDGTLKWQTELTYRGFVSPVLPYGESSVFVPTCNLVFPGAICYPLAVALSTTSGLQVGSVGLAGMSAGSPWGTIYFTPGTVQGAVGLIECAADGSACTQISGGDMRGVATFVGTTAVVVNANVSPNFLLRIQAIDRSSGAILWTAVEDFANAIADVSGAIYAIAPATNDIVALDGRTGVQLWRQHFESLPSALLLGDDGSLYTTVGTTLYKSEGAPAKTVPVVLVHGYCSDPTAFGNMAKLLRQDLPAPAIIYEYNYAHLTNVDRSFLGNTSDNVSIEAIAADLRQKIEAAFGADQQVDIVAHSMGGLVARTWINSPFYRGQVRRLITLGTPHYGVGIKGDSKLTLACSQLQHDQQRWGSAFLSDLHDAWIANSHKPSSNNILFIAGDPDCGGLDARVINCSDGLVHIQSAVLPDSVNIRYVPYWHSATVGLYLGTAIAEVDNDTHKSYQLVKRFLREGVIISQCCEAGSLGHNPIFLQKSVGGEGFLVVRVRDAASGLPVSSLGKISFNPDAQISKTFPHNENPDGGAFTYFPLVAPSAYQLTLELGGGYPNVDIGTWSIQRLLPTVLPVQKVRKR